MDTSAETTIVDYRLTFADQENKLLFSISFAANKRKFAVTLFHFQKVVVFR
jgi:hypothetical protein